MGDIVISGGVRYRAADAKRLGLVADGKVITARSVAVKTAAEVAAAAAAEAAEVAAAEAAATAAKEASDALEAATAGSTPPADPATGDTPPVVPAAAATATVARPAGNGSKADWEEFALAQGIPAVALEGKSRDEIAAIFATPQA